MRDRYPEMEKPAGFDLSRLRQDEIKLFPPLAAEPEDIAGYLRTGGCSACGACCTAFVIPLDPAARENITAQGLEFVDVAGPAHRIQVPVDPVVIGKAETADWEHWLGLHDTWLFQASYQPNALLTADLPVKCHSCPGPMTTEEWFVWLEARGVAVLRREGQQVLAYITRKCDEIGEDGLCQVYGMPQRPQMCGEYPQHPTDVQGIGFCTYKFAPVERALLMARSLIGQGRPVVKSRKKKGKRKKR